ncbi:hypothetical protein [Burkholderia cepacia]|uniref:hypothetical protein n=1 Tax=Burkholderia cepacia TaxID=292 RepID=UPI0020196961|nr:hypothetical protein [Burkholderia cepacia]UQO35519.1 hypothetical protein L0Z22_07215 [Burkholderia cepacia]UQO45831.1 hypothetical protein L0Z05_09015 [Burkholderia cepacia]UQP10915.1 hypothetical protein L0Z01_22765 [Burkholderia cepacia]
MKIFLSGEGPTDLGCCNNATTICEDGDFTPGPMTILVDSIIEETYNYSPLEIDKAAYRFVSKARLVELAKASKRGMALPGKKHRVDTGYFYVNAWMLGRAAKEFTDETADTAIAVLFRDTDGTNSSPNDLWDMKWNSMIEGFARAEYEHGVPMLPKPKSEAWILCAAQNLPYQNCSALEDLSGNDDAPDSAKGRLHEEMDGRTSAADVSEWLREHGFDHTSAAGQMPSYHAFRLRLMEVLEMCR